MLHAVSSSIRTGLCALDYNQSLSIHSKGPLPNSPATSFHHPDPKQNSVQSAYSAAKPVRCSLTIPHSLESVTVPVEIPVVSQEQALTCCPLYVPKPPSVLYVHNSVVKPKFSQSSTDDPTTSPRRVRISRSERKRYSLLISSSRSAMSAPSGLDLSASFFSHPFTSLCR
jgi:hypothetical protein